MCICCVDTTPYMYITERASRICVVTRGRFSGSCVSDTSTWPHWLRWGQPFIHIIWTDIADEPLLLAWPLLLWILLPALVRWLLLLFVWWFDCCCCCCRRNNVFKHSYRKMYCSSVWTISILWLRRYLTISATSILTPACNESIKKSKAIKVPVRPTPALQCTTGIVPGSLALLNTDRNEIRSSGLFGIRWSFHSK